MKPSRAKETHGPNVELLRHFVLRFFDSELITTPGQWVAFLVKSLPFVAAAFFMITPSLNAKYRHVAARHSADLYRQVSFADELWLITLTMAVVGLLATIKWQSLFPSRLDYMVLGSLPLKARQIFLAKLEALILVAAGAIAIVNVIPSVLFPAVSFSPLQVNSSLIAHVAVHGTVSALASWFFFFGLVAVQGLMANVVPRRYLAQVSSYVQGLLISLMLVLITLSFSIGMPVVKTVLRPEWAVWLPPVWFLGLYQTLLGDSDPLLAPLAARALVALTSAIVLALATCFVSYHRRRRLAGDDAPRRSAGGRLAGAIFDWLVPDPRQQAVLVFMVKTLARSGQHRMLLMGYLGLAVALTLSGLVGIERLVRPTHVVSACFAYAHTVLLLFVLIGLRHLFAIPSELRANWTFQITEREGRNDWFRAVERFVLVVGAMLILAAPFPFEAVMLGWRAVAESSVFAAGLLVCYEFLFMEWEKLPFTCSYLPGKSPGTMLAIMIAGFMGILPVVNFLVVSAVYHPLVYVIVMGLLGAIWIWARHTRQMIWGKLRLMWEESPEPAVRSLNLGAG
jgi:hypothetical protein